MVARRSARLKASQTHQETNLAPNRSTHGPGNAVEKEENTKTSEADISAFEQQRLEKIRANAARLAELTSLADDLAVHTKPLKQHSSTKGVKKTRVNKNRPVPPSLRRTRASGLDEQSQRYAAGLASSRNGRMLLEAPDGQSRSGAQDAQGEQGTASAVPEVPIGVIEMHILLNHPIVSIASDEHSSIWLSRAHVQLMIVASVLCPADSLASMNLKFPGVPQVAESVNCDSDETMRFLSCLNSFKCTESTEEADPHLHRQNCGVRSLSLQEGNVAKVVKDAIVEMNFMPLAGDRQCVIAACDKRGQVGLWGSNPWDPDSASDLGEEGVLLMHPHEAYACALCWINGNLLTASYDGTVRLLDVETATWTVLRRDDVDGFSSMGTRGQQMLLLGFDVGHLSFADCRMAPTPPTLKAMLLHDKRINTVHCAPVGGSCVHEFVTSSSDASVKVWDSRLMRPSTKKGAMLKPVAELSHTKSCHGAYFDSAGQRIVTTSYDNTVCIWHSSGNKWEQKARWRHNNQTGRWILPFRARWGPDGDSVICGDMSRGISAWASGEEATSVQVLQSEFMTAIPSRLAVDSTNGIVAAATGSGRVHLWTPPDAPVRTGAVKEKTSSANTGCSIQ